MADKHNFVLFFPDEMRASSVSCYGEQTVNMPNFDRLAAEGTRFDTCIVQNPVCTPSRCSLMTGLYVHNGGHRSLWHNLRPHEPSLFRYLKNAGYDIAWYGKNDLYSQEYLEEIVGDLGHKRGTYPPTSREPAVLGGKNPHPPDDPRYYSFLYGPLPEEAGEPRLDVHIARGLDFLESRTEADKPFMLYLPITQPHPPYQALARFHGMYNPDEVAGGVVPPDAASGKPAYVDMIRKSRRLDELDAKVFAEIYAVYLGMNSYVDYMLGQVLDVLESTGLAENTTVIVCSDHGDWAGNYGLVEKWSNAMEDDLVRVPLLIKTPGGQAGHVVREPVEMFDIMPTVLELAGIACTHDHFAQSLAGQLRGAPGDPNRAAFCEGGYDARDDVANEWRSQGAHAAQLRNPHTVYYPKVRLQYDHPESIARTAMVRTMAHKLNKRTSGEHELYDLVNDPKELHNQYHNPKYAAVRQELETRLLDWYLNTSDTIPKDYDPRGFKRE
jgi:choline-sulfatase